jgi:hypothetical protein
MPVSGADTGYWIDPAVGGTFRVVVGLQPTQRCSSRIVPVPKGGTDMRCSPEFMTSRRVQREALRQLELAEDDDQRLPSLEQLAVAALSQLDEQAACPSSDDPAERR